MSSSELASTVVSGPETIATRMTELASVRFGSRTGIISADIGELLTAIRFRAEARTINYCESSSNKRLASAGSGFQLDLKIALSGGFSEGPAPSGFSARPKMR